MNISVVIPVLNEEKTVERVLTSFSNQSLLPSEVIIVDGGSRDETLQVIKQFKKDTTLDIKVIVEKGANRSIARNLGIEAAQHDIIAVTDAGSFAKKDWLEKLTKPFAEKTVDSVAGFYDIEVSNAWQDAMADFTSVRSSNFDPESFLPSSRSFAFKKSLWKEVGGYPEELDTCEDLVFAQRMKKNAKGWKVAKEAQVIWLQPTSLSQLQDKIFHYALGDLAAQYDRHVKKIYSACWRVGILLVVALPLVYAVNSRVRMFGIGLFALYIIGSIGKHRHLLSHPLALLFIPLLQITVDATLVQALLFHRMSGKRKKTTL